MRTFLALLLLLACTTSAPHWRMEAQGGIAFPQTIGTYAIKPYPSPYPTYGPMTLPHDRAVSSAVGGLRLMRSDSSWEYGLGISALAISFRAVGVDSNQNYHNQYVYFGRPVLPLTAFFNYRRIQKKLYAYAGLNAGVLLSKGQRMQDANTLRYDQTYTIYFNNGTGYTIGGQLGIRRALGKLDAGFQLQMNYANLNLTQGTSNTPFRLRAFYFPLQLTVGYSF